MNPSPTPRIRVSLDYVQAGPYCIRDSFEVAVPPLTGHRSAEIRDSVTLAISGGYSDALGRLQARIHELEEEVVRLKLETPPPAALRGFHSALVTSNKISELQHELDKAKIRDEQQQEAIGRLNGELAQSYHEVRDLKAALASSLECNNRQAETIRDTDLRLKAANLNNQTLAARAEEASECNARQEKMLRVTAGRLRDLLTEELAGVK